MLRDLSEHTKILKALTTSSVKQILKTLETYTEVQSLDYRERFYFKEQDLSSIRHDLKIQIKPLIDANIFYDVLPEHAGVIERILKS